MATTTIQVNGMTCGHCVTAVTEELTAVPGVLSVDVDLHAGETSTVVLTTDREPDRGSVADAVIEAGYTLA